MKTKILSEYDIYINDGNYGNIYPDQKEFGVTGVPFISATDFRGRIFNYEGIKYISHAMHEKKLTKGHLKIGDVLVVVRGNGVGKVGYFKDKIGDCNINAQLAFIRTNPKTLNSLYLYYLLSSNYYLQLVRKFGSGSAQPQLPINRLKMVPIIDKDIEDQQKIANVLSILDDKIELNRKINAELEQMARTLYDYWFVQFDFPDANGKPYKSSGGQMAYSDQLKREIPADWKAVQLEDILNKRTENAEPNSNLKCIDLSVMPSGSLSIDSFSAGDAFNSNMKKMHKNDILFGSIRPYLKKAGLAPFDGLRAGTVHAFYPRKPEHLEFCLITMTSERYFDYAINRSGGSTRMPSISSDDLLDYSVPFSEDVYFKYHKVLTSFTDAISNNIQQSQKLAELRDWLLPMLMNGQVRVK